MAYTYKGTKINDTSNAKKAGHAAKKKNETYLNTKEGHVYVSTDKGTAKSKIWKYKETVVVKKPTVGVAKLGAPSRSGTKMKAKWQVPDEMISKTRGDRATGLKIQWSLGINPGRDPYKLITDANERHTSSEIDLNNFWYGRTKYTRDSFYPVTNLKLDYVSVKVSPYNKKATKGAKPATATAKFEVPDAPSIGDYTFDTTNGKVSVTVTSGAGADLKERKDTWIKMTVVNKRTGETTTPYNRAYASTSVTLTYDVIDYQQLTYDEYVEIKVEAYCRGYKGNSTTARKSYYVGYPAQASIEGIDVTGKTSADKCTVRIKTNNSTEHPVDTVRLEYLANVTYSTAGEIPAEADWQSTEIIDNKDCTALAMPVGDLIPEKGKYSWVRVKTHHLNEDVLKRYSEFKRVEALEVPAPTAADDDIVILDTNPGKDGTSAVILLGWNADGQDDSTGTELTWADEADAWKSTKDPDDYTFTWSDGAITYDNVTYQDSAEIVIKGLKEGTKYYVRARRYLEGDVTTYSPYSNIATVLTSEIPESIVATCDSYIPTGSSLPVYWTFSGNGVQTNWQIVSSTGIIIAKGEGSMGSTQISASRLEELAVNNSITFTVQASTGSDFVSSDEKTVTIIDNPTLAISTLTPLTVQPLEFDAEVSALCDLIVIVSSLGTSGQYPDGMREQTLDDTVYSGVIAPVWTEGQDSLTATIQLPPGLDFWDLGNYRLSVTAIDRETGLRSEEQKAEFSVAWAHQAVSPASTVTYTASADVSVDDDKNYYSYDAETQTYTVVYPEGDESPTDQGWYEQTTTDFITLTPIDTVDDSGVHIQAVEISLTPPTGSGEDDLYDIYRMTGDGVYLIGEGFPLTHTTRDDYAPFGDMAHHYRIALRTPDGDVAFADFEYELPCNRMRFDWSGGTLELPYNLSIGDSYKKDVEVRAHMGGSTDAYWNSNIERTASLSSDAIRLTQQDDIDTARQLGRYPGAVFVRTPDGSAYEADVQVSDLSTEGKVATIGIDATEIGLTQEFLLPIPYTLTEEEP